MSTKKGTGQYVFLGVGTLCFGLGYYYNIQGKKDYDKSLELYEEYKNTTSDFDSKWQAYQDKFDSHETKFTYRNIFYITTILSTGFSIYTICLHKKSINEEFSIKVYPNQMVFVYKF